MGKTVVITGYGVVTPFGRGTACFASTIFAGKHRFREIQGFDVTATYAKRGAEASVPDKSYRTFALQCTDDALQMAGFDLQSLSDQERLHRAVVAVGNLGDGMHSREFYQTCLMRNQPGKPAPDNMERNPFVQADLVAKHIGSEARRLAFTNACVASANAIGYGFDMIRNGRTELVLAGGINVLHPLVYYNFDSSRAMAEDVVRPFSKGRSGLLIGDGAAMLVLESWEHAKARGADPIAELCGWGISADGYHITRPDPSGSGLARAMRMAMKQACCPVEEVDYINAHGTGTPLNDIAETRAMKQVFGDQAARIPVSSTKSSTGHMLEATGAVEAVISLYAMEHGIIPPTANYLGPDEELDLDYVTEGPRRKMLHTVLSNSCAFGGNNCSLLFRRRWTG
ncbi:beta-ketoacyl-[acyl-carrier-protein] synthase family protein [Xylanibacillus composti]|uniref:3-oxoacyl-[acyl-carrier-protein] synthase 2 n=1 Tax=Xylanibacillus composti TaxID=1572762 RepID=A0A8J4M2F4_9BACL|nr:beta-ketoacyl-[acyl-carrier-protein] synthase family protein [Xylanibacillus composti]MDT9727117.1 beta-ketoacyl-[acyl-carrier-protein] synthase family protein [Xylanibacillus composti]GIQ68872.1 3-oxoacyl-[acyl-carrier-protein] synthase 2 [Xylanibacillus composti]